MFIEMYHETHGVGLLNINSGIFFYPFTDSKEPKEIFKTGIHLVPAVEHILDSIDTLWKSIETPVYSGITYSELKENLKLKGLLMYEFPLDELE